MSKEFVPYQPSLDMKEIGFDEPCFGYFNTTSHLGIGSFVFKECDKNTIDGYGNKPLLRPTFSQAFRWLLKHHNLYGVIIPTETMNWTFKTMTVVEGIVEVPPYKICP